MNQIRRFTQEVIGTVQNSARQARSANGDERYLKGFTKAADLSLRSIDAKLDTYRQQMTSGSLSKPDQAVYAGLTKLKSEIEAECHRFWRDSGIDWHPSTPAVKATLRPKPEQEPTSDD